MQRAIAHVFPPQPETLVGTQPAVKQDSGNVSQQERVRGFGWWLPAHGSSDALESTLIGLLNRFTDCRGAFQIPLLFFRRQHPVTMIFAREHLHLRQRPVDLAPFRRQLLHPPQDL
ncbi:MAG: hypothetical protein ACLP59_06640 [Bryobacteraceae bacterium]